MLVPSGVAAHPATGGLGFVSGSCEGPAGVKAALTCRLLPPWAAAALKKDGTAALDVLLSSRGSRLRYTPRSPALPARARMAAAPQRSSLPLSPAGCGAPVALSPAAAPPAPRVRVTPPVALGCAPAARCEETAVGPVAWCRPAEVSWPGPRGGAEGSALPRCRGSEAAARGRPPSGAGCRVPAGGAAWPRGRRRRRARPLGQGARERRARGASECRSRPTSFRPSGSPRRRSVLRHLGTG